jgi:hypothetical protein
MTDKIVFPSPVIFKGDNDKYLKVFTISSSEANFLQFSGAKHENESKFEVLNQADGYVAIKSLHNQRYWTGNPGEWIKVTNSSINEYSLFKPVLFENKRVAFLTKYSNKYAKRLTTSGNYISFLNADRNYIDDATPMNIEEPVVRRTVRNVVYDLDKAIITDLQPLVIAEQTASNSSSYKNDVTVNYTHSYTITKSWSHSFSVTVGVETEFKCGIPFIAEGKVGVSVETSYTGQWETSEETTDSISGAITIKDVDPGKKVKVYVHGERSKLTVPFRYEQIDYYSDGSNSPKTLDDGVFYGVSEYTTGWETSDIPK